MHVDTDVAAPRTEPAREVRRHRSGPASEIENEIAGAEQSETIDPVRHLARRAFEEMHGARLPPQPERRKALSSRRPAPEGVRRPEEPQTCGTKLPDDLKRGGGKGSSERVHAFDHERYGAAPNAVARPCGDKIPGWILRSPPPRPPPQRERARSAWSGSDGSATPGALARQREAAGPWPAGGEETLFLLEHEPVFTLGRNASPTDILWPDGKRSVSGIEVHESDRGGKVTYHGPGQLVGYPILNLSPDRRDVKRYVTDLEEVLIRSLAGLGISAARSPRKERVTSVWVGNDKIAAIGVHIARWVTTHGFALNVTDEPLGEFLGHRALRNHRRRRHVGLARSRKGDRTRGDGPARNSRLRGDLRPGDNRNVTTACHSEEHRDEESRAETMGADPSLRSG